MKKHEYRKHEKNLYLPKTEPVLITVPLMKYICIDGEGNPNNEDFAKRVKVLYSLAYKIKMMLKKETPPDGYFDFTVYPLEGLWSITDEAKLRGDFSKDELVYTIMIRQPDFIDYAIFDKAVNLVLKKDETGLAGEVYFDEIEDGLSVQMMHLGSYDNENETFDIMQKYIDENNLELKTKVHREIYLSDARKTEKEKLKTVLRYRVKEID